MTAPKEHVLDKTNSLNFTLLKLEVRDAIILDMPGLKRVAQKIEEEMPYDEGYRIAFGTFAIPDHHTPRIVVFSIVVATTLLSCSCLYLFA